MMHRMAEGTFVLAVGVIPGTLKFMVVVYHALIAVLHFSRVIARLANSLPFS